MIRTCFKLFVAAVAIVSVAHSAQARGQLTTKYKYYTVSGSSAASLHRNMTVPTGFFSSERVYANITMNASLKGAFVQGKRCRLKGFGINGKFVVRLPKLRPGTKLSPGLNRKFKSFAAYVRKHELTHRSIWTRCLRSAESRIRRLKIKSCSRFDAQAAKIITDEWAKCETRNALFDKREQKRLLRLPLVKAAFKPARRSKRVVRKTKSPRTGVGSRTSRSLGKYNE